jgi:putative transcription factor
MDGQDWQPVIFKKRAPTTAKEAGVRNGYQTTSKLKSGTRGSVNGQRLAKIDRTEIGDIPKVSKSVGKAIAKGRLAKGLSQRILAQKCNVKPEVIASYELGKAQPSQAILLKIQRNLGVRLTGKQLGEPL